MDKEEAESQKERRERRKMERENKEWLEGSETSLQKLISKGVRGRRETGLMKLFRKRHKEREERRRGE